MVKAVDGMVQIDLKNSNAPMLLNGHGMLPFQGNSITMPSTPIPGTGGGGCGQQQPLQNLYQQHQQQMLMNLLVAQHRTQQRQMQLLDSVPNIYNDPGSLDDLESNMSPEYASAGSLINAASSYRRRSNVPPSPPPNHPSHRNNVNSLLDPSFAAAAAAFMCQQQNTLPFMPFQQQPHQQGIPAPQPLFPHHPQLGFPDSDSFVFNLSAKFHQFGGSDLVISFQEVL
ncbi:hypothetical protein Ciccas_004526 [Cichlidogyrus casuarinus]|uniref:Uncharacterized protein n=1 Tax=Cichlidogyrus casuarinus TaxID=1844966 RepID=A0ABD2QBB0_9PLAT